MSAADDLHSLVADATPEQLRVLESLSHILDDWDGDPAMFRDHLTVALEIRAGEATRDRERSAALADIEEHIKARGAATEDTP
jgi:hypothetical protein